MQTSDEIDPMVSEFAGDIKGTIRRHAIRMPGEGKIYGYLAYDGDTAVGWCNAGNMDDYIKNRYQTGRGERGVNSVALPEYFDGRITQGSAIVVIGEDIISKWIIPYKIARSWLMAFDERGITK